MITSIYHQMRPKCNKMLPTKECWNRTTQGNSKYRSHQVSRTSKLCRFKKNNNWYEFLFIALLLCFVFGCFFSYCVHFAFFFICIFVILEFLVFIYVLIRCDYSLCFNHHWFLVLQWFVSLLPRLVCEMWWIYVVSVCWVCA